jgi:hypothetical protein
METKVPDLHTPSRPIRLQHLFREVLIFSKIFAISDSQVPPACGGRDSYFGLGYPPVNFFVGGTGDLDL